MIIFIRIEPAGYNPVVCVQFIQIRRNGHTASDVFGTFAPFTTLDDGNCSRFFRNRDRGGIPGGFVLDFVRVEVEQNPGVRVVSAADGRGRIKAGNITVGGILGQ